MCRLTPFSWSTDIQLIVTRWLLTHRHGPLPHLLIHSFFPQVFTIWWWQPLSQSTQQFPNNLCMLDTEVRTLKFTVCAHKTHTKNVKWLKWPLSSEAEISAKGPGKSQWRSVMVTCSMFRCVLPHWAPLTNFLSQLYKKIKFKNFSL